MSASLAWKESNDDRADQVRNSARHSRAGHSLPRRQRGRSARRGVKPYYSETYETKGPVRGYEGFLFPDYYCSYKRYPNRDCSVDAQGRERCRVIGWRLEQTCQ
jgi:hypothetical protein